MRGEDLAAENERARAGLGDALEQARAFAEHACMQARGSKASARDVSEGQALLERLRAAASQLAGAGDSLGEALAQLLGADAAERPRAPVRAENYQGFLPALAALCAEFERLAGEIAADAGALRARF